MDEYDILLIRACKAFPNARYDNLRRLRRIWAMRCGIRLTDFNLKEIDSYITSHLMDLIADEMPKEDLKRFMLSLARESGYWDELSGYGCDASEHVHRILIKTISFLRLSRVDKFSNFIAPAKFRS